MPTEWKMPAWSPSHNWEETSVSVAERYRSIEAIGGREGDAD